MHHQVTNPSRSFPAQDCRRVVMRAQCCGQLNLSTHLTLRPFTHHCPVAEAMQSIHIRSIRALPHTKKNPYLSEFQGDEFDVFNFCQNYRGVSEPNSGTMTKVTICAIPPTCRHKNIKTRHASETVDKTNLRKEHPKGNRFFLFEEVL